MRSQHRPKRGLARFHPLMALFSIGLLSACNPAEINTDTLTGDLLNQGPGVSPLFIAADGKDLIGDSTESGQVINCYKERFVHPPNHENRSIGYRFIVKDEWAGKVDWESLAVNLDEADFDFTTDIDGHEVRFTNPGKSRAVIDISYCTIPHDTAGDGSGGTGGTGDGTTTGGGTGDWNPTDDGGIFVTVN